VKTCPRVSESVVFFYVKLLFAVPVSCAEATKKGSHLLVCCFYQKSKDCGYVELSMLFNLHGYPEKPD